jgi:molybdopterin converting factor small subunit
MNWELPLGSSVKTLLTYLVKEVPAFGDIPESPWIAVNRSYATLETTLKDGDEVALFPPVSGG